MLITVKCYEESTQKRQIETAMSLLNAVQNHFFFELQYEKGMDLCKEEIILWEDFCKRHTQNKDEYIIYITEKAFCDNWFSHEERRFAVISTHDWEDKFAPPSVKAYLIYQIAQATLSFQSDLSESMEMKLVHDKAQGCIFDFCGHKADIKLGMVAGNICPQCKAGLKQYGLDEGALTAIERMLTLVRSEAIGKPIIFDENAAFVIMKFSTNDENNNAYIYGIVPALEKLGIKCVRADNEIYPGQLLEKIESNIHKCRFIIAKVDTDNLNVYYELGLAMGQHKDVLLISEKEFVPKLPSDLRNWECLTYTSGAYDDLKEKIINYFRENFQYYTRSRNLPGGDHKEFCIN